MTDYLHPDRIDLLADYKKRLYRESLFDKIKSYTKKIHEKQEELRDTNQLIEDLLPKIGTVKVEIDEEFAKGVTGDNAGTLYDKIAELKANQNFLVCLLVKVDKLTNSIGSSYSAIQQCKEILGIENEENV